MCWVLFPIKKYEKNNDQEFMLTLFLSRYFFLITTGIKIDEQTLKRRGKKRCTWSQGHWSRHVQIKSSRQLTMLENNCLMLKLFIYDLDKIKELTQFGLIRTWHHTMYTLVFYCKDNKDNNSVITYHRGGSQLNFPQPPPFPLVPSWNHVIPQKILINNDCPIKKKIFSYMHLLFSF